MSLDYQMLYAACKSGDAATVRMCLARGADVNIKYFNGSTPLMTAISHNNPQVVTVLLASQHLDIAAADNQERTALHWACSANNAACIAILRADRRLTVEMVNRKDTCGSTALMWAVNNGFLSSVEELAKLEELDWETKNKDGESLEDVAR